LTEEITKWMNNLLKINVEPNTLLEALASGETLCELVLLINPQLKKDKIVPKIHKDALDGSHFARDNIACFLKVSPLFLHIICPPILTHFCIYD
jgi:hypothetical protein